MNAKFSRCYAACSSWLVWLTVAWLPLVVCIHRVAAFFVPVLVGLAQPRLTRHKCLWAFVGWAVLSLAWAPDPIRGLHVAVCAALFLLVWPSRSWHVASHVVCIMVLLAVLAQTLLIWLGIGHKNAPLLYAPVSLTLSLLCAVYPSWLMFFCSFWLGWVIDCDTALLATIGVAIARYMPLTWLNRIWKVLWIVVGLGLVGIHHLHDKHIESIQQFSNSFSHLHRVYLYREISALVQKEPLTKQLRGFGLDSSRIVGEKKFTINVLFGHNQGQHISKTIPLHPHNVILQILVELGWVGLILAGFCLWSVRLKSKGEALVMYVAACHALVSVGVWQTWWMASVWLAYWLACMRQLDHAT